MNIMPQSTQEKLSQLNREKEELQEFLNNSFGHPASVNGAVLNRLGEINREIKKAEKEVKR